MPCIADPKEKMDRLVAEMAVKQLAIQQTQEKIEAKEEEIAPKVAELRAPIVPLQETKAALESEFAEIKKKLETEFLDVDKDDLHPILNPFDKKEWEYDVNEMTRWLMTFAPHVLVLNAVAVKERLNSVADSKKESARWFDVLGCPAKLVKRPTITVHTSKLAKYLPDPALSENVDDGSDAEPETQPIPKTAADLVEQIRNEPDVPAVFNNSL